MKKIYWQALIIGGVLVLASEAAMADLGSDGIMNTVLKKFDTAASSWAIALTDAASRLFWTLVLISMVWTFGMMALRKADIGEFFAEFFRFTVFTGFFWWLLTNAVTGMNIAGTIISSMQQLGAQAGGLGSTKLDPGAIVDIGFDLFGKILGAVDQLGWKDFDMAIAMMILGGIILAILALISVNLLLLLATSWIVLYAGIFFLGFGGSRWTSDMAMNYYRTILGIAVQLLTMILVVAIGKSFLENFTMQISSHTTIQELAVMMVVSIILLVLTNKVPTTIAGIITGASMGNTGIGQLGAGAMIGAGAVTAGAFASGGVALAHGLEKAGVAGAGALSSLMAAVSQANANVASGSDVLTSLWGGEGGSDPSGGPGGGGLPGTGNTPLAEAAGFASPMGSSAPAGGDNGGAAASGASDSGDTVADSDGGHSSAGGESSGSGIGASSSGGRGSNGTTAQQARNRQPPIQAPAPHNNQRGASWPPPQ
ncbi:P-type conjugative transfer protein TrbL [Sedimenticola hydrogenitrophicus]|uniref:P-type conjugative transfer protein TrbL n=1 Tax=Sedimenticola hydrogenitrophicus TaxID=2967975 RepID=UPI0021A2A01D|nr:P-type conjugative transfer protein TrbL [Sedimenticola hydrogenitrophicus]